MDFTLTDEQRQLKETARDFCEKEIKPRIRQMIKERKIPPSIYEGLSKMNFLGMTIPEKYGGIGADAISTGIVAGEIARADPTASIPVLFLVHNAWSYLIAKYGTESLKDKILPDAARGKKLIGIASTEPNFGSDIGSMVSYAERKGKIFIATGEKSYISLVRDIAERGGGFVTVLKTDRSKKTDGVSLFYMPYDRTFDITYLEEMGREGSSWAAFKFKDIEIPEEYMLGKLNQGFRIIHEGFEFARGLISLISTASASSALENGIAYLKERKAFGKEISRFQGLQFQLADHVARIEAAETVAYKALYMYDQEQKYHKFSRFEVSKQIAIAKLLSTTWAFDAINDALQWQGAYGYSKDCPEEWALRGIRSFQLAEGSREIMKVIIARETLGKEYM